jgi:hypothetical protein
MDQQVKVLVHSSQKVFSLTLLVMQMIILAKDFLEGKLL